MKLNNIFYSFDINGKSVSSVEQYDYLDLVIDNYLNWAPHITKICKKISPYIGAIKRIRYSLNIRALKCLYFSYIHSRLIYNLPIWGSAPQCYLRTVALLQKKALKYIYHLPIRYPSNLIFNDIHLSFHQQFIYESVLFIHKARSKIIECDNLMLSNIDITRRNTRSSNHLRIPSFKKTFAQKSVFYKGKVLYNNVPQSIKIISDFNHFRIELKKFANFTFNSASEQ
jgi:hypothetical protein